MKDGAIQFGHPDNSSDNKYNLGHGLIHLSSTEALETFLQAQDTQSICK